MVSPSMAFVIAACSAIVFALGSAPHGGKTMRAAADADVTESAKAATRKATLFR